MAKPEIDEETLKRDIAILRQYNPEMTEEEAREHAIKQREIIARDLDRQREVIETIHRIIPDATEAECGEIQVRLRFIFREDTTLKEWYDFESKVEAIAEQRRQAAEWDARLERLEAAQAAHAAADAADHAKIAKHTEGVPPLVADAREETSRTWRQLEDVKALLGFTSKEEFVYKENFRGSTQAEIAKKTEWSLPTVKRLTKSANAKLERHGRPAMKWHNRKKDNSDAKGRMNGKPIIGEEE